MKPNQTLKEVRGIFGSRFMAPMPDPHIGGVIQKDSVRELQLTAAILAECHGKKRFVDVGANIGWHTVLVGIKNPRMEIHAFEPHPETYRILAENLRINGGMENTTAWEIGAGDEHAQVEMFEHPESLGGSQPWARDDWQGAEKKLIQIRRLDSGALPLVSGPVDVMKMEVQGYEVKAFKGCAGLRIETLFITYAPRMIRGAGDDPRELLAMLRAKYRRVERIDAKCGLCELREDDLDRTAAKGDIAVFFDLVCRGLK